MATPGKPSQEETQRNLALYNDFMSLKSQNLKSYQIMGELMPKYKISQARIWKIISREKLKHQI